MKSKNIHILKTDKPSRLLKDLVDETYQFKKEVSYGNRFELPLNIYITSDEEIKKGDYVNGGDWNEIEKIKHQKEVDNLKLYKDGDFTVPYKKIILTTDQDLIKDGVQAIDDEFLEWFVKNPSCDFAHLGFTSIIGDSETKRTYKIIIPKEEPTFENSIDNTMNIMSIANSMFGKKEEPKQETLEEAAERISKSHSVHETGQDDVYQGVIQGAKWQQEQCEKDLDAHLDVAKTLWLQAVKENKKMYSEEESIQKIIDYVDFQFNTKRELNLEIKKWFEQFKKK